MSIFVLIGIIVAVAAIFTAGVLVGAHNAAKVEAEKTAVTTAASAAKAVVK